ncbi:hypothetical protein JAAARDRAFT_140643 [Jaapia argillacea MUCL 33604]|uniref:NADAR domain-containing protein n=1 Tax=Jaapia argillacea MUCL 33604 TaxID=933084 RepID=A0A067P8Q0_9AGAM|nr:hypothetical protein JAAARDRAFT_140643 [Jaapia argillacea MUCL 33604]
MPPERTSRRPRGRQSGPSNVNQSSRGPSTPPYLLTPPLTFSQPPIRFSWDSSFKSFLPNSSHRILYRNQLFPTMLHLLQAFKLFDDREDLPEHLRLCGEVAITGNNSPRLEDLARPDRGMHVLDWMDEALYLKFTQHPELRELLLNTGSADLVFVSMTDSLWGEGPDGRGNFLGKALMGLRQRFRIEMSG